MNTYKTQVNGKEYIISISEMEESNNNNNQKNIKSDVRFCWNCGSGINVNAVICPSCGCMIKKDSIKTGTNSSGSDKKTQTSVILGIIGIVFAWLFALVGHIVSIIGIVQGIKEYKDTEKMTGLILSIIGEVCSIFSSIIGAVAFSGLF